MALWSAFFDLKSEMRLVLPFDLSTQKACGGEDQLTKAERDALVGVLANDPRPGYDDDPSKEYGLNFARFDVGFFVKDGTVHIVRLRCTDD